MLHPFEKITPRMFRARVLAFVPAMLAVGYFMFRLGQRFEGRRDAAGRTFSMLDFEFARTPERAGRILEAWGAEGITYAQAQIWLDFLFIACYSTVLALGCIWAMHRFGRYLPERAAVAAAGRPLAFAMGVAGLCDAVENYALLRILYGQVETAYTHLAFGCAGVKFALIGAGVIYIGTGALARWMRPGEPAAGT